MIFLPFRKGANIECTYLILIYRKNPSILMMLEISMTIWNFGLDIANSTVKESSGFFQPNRNVLKI